MKKAALRAAFFYSVWTQYGSINRFFLFNIDPYEDYKTDAFRPILPARRNT